LLSVLPKKTGKKINIFKNRQSGIKVTPQSLGHISNAGAVSLALTSQTHVHPEHHKPARLQLARTSNQAKQRRFPDPIRTNHTGNLSPRQIDTHPIQSPHCPITLNQIMSLDDVLWY